MTRPDHGIRVALVLAGLGVAAPARAQLCTGDPSFDGAPIQVNGGVGFATSARSVGGGIAVGGGKSIFGGIAGSVTALDAATGATGNGYSIGGFVGQDNVVDRAGRIHFCPIVEVSHMSGPSFFDVATNTNGVDGGAQFGIEAGRTPSVIVVPTFGLRVVYLSTSASFLSERLIQTKHYATVNFGIGFVLHEHVSVRPTVTVPLGLEDGETAFTFGVSYNFK